MRSAGALLLLSALALVSACNDNQPALPPAAETKEKLTRFEFTVGGVRYAISLPEDAGMRDQGTDGVIFYEHKRQRRQRVMLLLAAPQKPGLDFDQQYLMRDESGRTDRKRADRVVHYRHLGKSEGGSGGAIEDIAGRVALGQHVLFLKCSDQGEWSISPTWCLQYLDTLAIVPPASSGN